MRFTLGLFKFRKIKDIKEMTDTKIKAFLMNIQEKFAESPYSDKPFCCFKKVCGNLFDESYVDQSDYKFQFYQLEGY